MVLAVLVKCTLCLYSSILVTCCHKHQIWEIWSCFFTFLRTNNTLLQTLLLPQVTIRGKENWYSNEHLIDIQIRQNWYLKKASVFRAHRLIYDMCLHAHIHPYTCKYIHLFGNPELWKWTPDPAVECIKVWTVFCGVKILFFVKKKQQFQKKSLPLLPPPNLIPI